ncbi:acyltransferase [Shewanella algae]|uniref:acyltransferase n=1 Tax=Shewanella algae TaxID=38313 RepID=UPI001C55C53D|nr:acyltransferase [Shewanella algae]
MRRFISFVFYLVKKIKRVIFTNIASFTCNNSKGLMIANGFTRLTKNTSIGHNVHFNGMVVSGAGKVTIGDNFHSGEKCKIITQNHNINGKKLPYDETYIVKDVTIHDNVWLGDQVIILPGVTIGEGAVIQAGSVVVNDIPDLAIAGGHPAKVFSMRDSIHYNNLKVNKEFN